MLQLVVQCLNTRVDIVIRLVFVAPRLNQYRFVIQVFPEKEALSSDRWKKNSAISVQRVYRKQVGYKKTPFAATIKR